MRLYKALVEASECRNASQEGPPLCGFKCGNRYQSGCLTDDQTVRLHSCERGTSCTKLEASNIVWITPIIARATDGSDIPELGAGGGSGDLVQTHEIDLNDASATLELMKLCSKTINDLQARSKTLNLIANAVASSGKALFLDAADLADDLEGIPLADVARLLQHIAVRETGSPCQPGTWSAQQPQLEGRKAKGSGEWVNDLPRRIVSLVDIMP